jgi:hypothetical protein
MASNDRIGLMLMAPITRKFGVGVRMTCAAFNLALPSVIQGEDMALQRGWHPGCRPVTVFT